MKKALRITLGVLILCVSALHAEVHIEITQGIDCAQLIAVVPFKWTGYGSPPADISKIISSDLRNSGKFNLFDTTLIPQQPTTTSEVTTALWADLGIHAIVIGQIIPNAVGSYLVSYQLVDTSSPTNTILVQNQFKVTTQLLRHSAHAASNEIFERIIGTKGVFLTRIAYIVQTNNAKSPYELRVADYDGYNQFVVHRSPKPLMSPAWSPDGSKLAYVTFESGRSILVMQNLVNREVTQLSAFPGHNGAPAFSPDGNRIVFALSKNGSLHLYVMNLNSKQIRQITFGRSNNTEPSWFPDGQTLAYTSDQVGHPQIYKINTSNGVTEPLTWENPQNQNAKVSFDGKFLVMVTSDHGVQHIAKQDLGSGVVRLLTDTLLDETPSIAPNGTMVIYSSTQDMGSVLHLVSTNGHFKTRLPVTNGQVKFPAWSPYL